MVVMIRGDIMVSRMDKYRPDSAKNIQSRSKKNEHLYEQLYTNKVYTEFTNIIDDNVVDLQSFSQSNVPIKREDYQKNRILNSEIQHETSQIPTVDNSKKSDSLEDKNYDINSVLENAKRNRNIDDELKQKRYLKTVEYNILSDLTMDKLKEERDKQQKLTKEEEENLEELINTITSNSLRKKIDDELLSDLLPSKDSETIISKQLLDDLEQADSSDNAQLTDTNSEEDDDENEGIDKSFYTKSMDLSEEDFEMEEDNSFIDPPKMNLTEKILIVIFILLIISIIGYVLYRFI